MTLDNYISYAEFCTWLDKLCLNIAELFPDRSEIELEHSGGVISIEDTTEKIDGQYALSIFPDCRLEKKVFKPTHDDYLYSTDSGTIIVSPYPFSFDYLSYAERHNVPPIRYHSVKDLLDKLYVIKVSIQMTNRRVKNVEGVS